MRGQLQRLGLVTRAAAGGNCGQWRTHPGSHTVTAVRWNLFSSVAARTLILPPVGPTEYMPSPTLELSPSKQTRASGVSDAFPHGT
jgi:hypothetical protein